MNDRSRTSRWTTAASLAVALWMASPSLAQPDGPDGAPPPPPPGMDDGPGGRPDGPGGPGGRGRRVVDLTPERLRDMLVRQQEALRRRQERLALVLRLLDEGRTLEQIREEIPDLLRLGLDGPEGRRGGAGQMGPGGAGGPDEPDGAGRPGGPGRGPDEGDDHAGIDRLGPGPVGAGRADGPRDGRPGDGDAQRRPRRDGPLTAEERGAVEDFLTATAPRLLEKLRELEATDKALAERRWQEAFPRVRPLLDLRARDRALYDLRLRDIKLGREGMETARAIAETDAKGEAAAALQARLRTILREQYGVRTGMLEREIAREDARAAQMREELARRSSKADEVVEQNARAMVEREQRKPRKDVPAARPPRHGADGGPVDR